MPRSTQPVSWIRMTSFLLLVLSSSGSRSAASDAELSRSARKKVYRVWSSGACRKLMQALRPHLRSDPPPARAVADNVGIQELAAGLHRRVVVRVHIRVPIVTPVQPRVADRVPLHIAQARSQGKVDAARHAVSLVLALLK